MRILGDVMILRNLDFVAFTCSCGNSFRFEYNNLVGETEVFCPNCKHHVSPKLLKLLSDLCEHKEYSADNEDERKHHWWDIKLDLRKLI